MKTLGIFCVLFAVLLAIFSVLLGTQWQHNGASFALISGALILFVLGLGMLITDRPLGALITENNVMSLSRLQGVLWTLVLLAGYLSRVLWRIQWKIPDPLAVKAPESLWWLAGISTTALIGTPLILATKTLKTPEPKAFEKAATLTRLSEHEVKDNAKGTVFRNPSRERASFLDIFQGDEVGNAGYVDLTKVQMFFFTMVLAVAYLAMLAKLTQTGGGDLPDFSAGMVALLGISHAGYLGNKGVDHSGAK